MLTRPPKPTAIKIAEGNRGKFPKSKLKPDPRGIGHPRMPAHLTKEEQELWAAVVASLPVGLLSRADEQALERMAVAWAEFRDAKETIQKTGKLVQSPQGPVRNPLFVIRNQAERSMHQAGEVLGLSPVSRARLSASDAPDDDPMALLLGPDENPNGAWSTLPKTKQ